MPLSTMTARRQGRRPVRGQQRRAHRNRQEEQQADHEIFRVNRDRARPRGRIRIRADHEREVERRENQRKHVRHGGDRQRKGEIAAPQVRDHV